MTDTHEDLGTMPPLSFSMRTDRGVRRAVNEDAALAQLPTFLVADGMGGHEAGDLASQAAIAAFAAHIRPGAPSRLDAVGAALEAARDAVNEVARGRERGAGCTLSGVILIEQEGELCWLVLNIGDSRVYLHREGELVQLTIDHSLRDEMQAEGYSGEEILPARNIITRALGTASSVADSWILPVEAGARLLICTDGLTTELSDDELCTALTTGGEPDVVTEHLVRHANAAGGRDNITLVVVDTLDEYFVEPVSEAADDDTLPVGPMSVAYGRYS